MKAAWLLGIMLVAMVGLGGCAQATPPTEVTLAAVNREAAETRVTTYFVNGGFIAHAPDRMTLRFEREGDGVLRFFFGTNWDARAYYRIDVTILPVGEGYFRVIANPFVVGNRGSGYERVNDLGGDYKTQLEVMLKQMAAGATKPYDPKTVATTAPAGK